MIYPSWYEVCLSRNNMWKFIRTVRFNTSCPCALWNLINTILQITKLSKYFSLLSICGSIPIFSRRMTFPDHHSHNMLWFSWVQWPCVYVYLLPVSTSTQQTLDSLGTLCGHIQLHKTHVVDGKIQEMLSYVLNHLTHLHTIPKIKNDNNLLIFK